MADMPSMIAPAAAALIRELPAEKPTVHVRASRSTTPVPGRAPAMWWRARHGGLGHLGVQYARQMGLRP
jgi:hypothetical protein